MQWSSENLVGRTDGDSELYYSSADDDFMVDPLIFEAVVNEGRYLRLNRSWPQYPIMCTHSKLRYDDVVRDVKNKYYVSKAEYQWPSFPRSCLGGFYTMSVDFAAQLWRFSDKHQPLRLDDVWLTGILRQFLGVPDAMVVQPKKYAATHLTGFRGKGDSEAQGFMRAEWAAAYAAVSKRPHCCCKEQEDS